MTSRVQTLGNTTDFASKREIERRNWRNNQVISRYKLQDFARDLLPDERVSSCLRIPIRSGIVEVLKDRETGNAHVKGVGVCGSVWTCPVCSTKITIRRREELQRGMDAARDLGWYPVFVTYTARHTREDTALEMRERTREAQRLLKSGRWWKENIKSYGLNGVITGIETTYGHANGWHVHYHAIMFFDELPNLQDLEERLYERWFSVLAKVGLDCDREHGVVVKPGNHAAHYVSKWGLENEVTSGHKKAKDGHFTTFELLAVYAEGEKWAGEKFIEFVYAFKGVSQLRWSKGLRKALGVEAASDRELAEGETAKDPTVIARLEWKQYKRIIDSGRKGVIGEMLVVAECGELALFTWLLFEFNILLDYQ